MSEIVTELKTLLDYADDRMQFVLEAFEGARDQIAASDAERGSAFQYSATVDVGGSDVVSMPVWGAMLRSAGVSPSEIESTSTDAMPVGGHMGAISNLMSKSTQLLSFNASAAISTQDGLRAVAGAYAAEDDAIATELNEGGYDLEYARD